MCKCVYCGKDTEDNSRYCNWECTVAMAKAEGGEVHTPNGLPVRCIKHDGSMWEHEHGSHPDYKFPVEVEYVGKHPNRSWVDGEGNVEPMPVDLQESCNHQTHALIYTDGSVAVTMYEYCYAMWYLKDGKFAGGSLWEKGDWKMCPEDVAKCKALKKSS